MKEYSKAYSFNVVRGHRSPSESENIILEEHIDGFQSSKKSDEFFKLKTKEFVQEAASLGKKVNIADWILWYGDPETDVQYIYQVRDWRTFDSPSECLLGDELPLDDDFSGIEKGRRELLEDRMVTDRTLEFKSVLYGEAGVAENAEGSPKNHEHPQTYTCEFTLPGSSFNPLSYIENSIYRDGSTPDVLFDQLWDSRLEEYFKKQIEGEKNGNIFGALLHVVNLANSNKLATAPILTSDPRLLSYYNWHHHDLGWNPYDKKTSTKRELLSFINSSLNDANSEDGKVSNKTYVKDVEFSRFTEKKNKRDLLLLVFRTGIRASKKAENQLTTELQSKFWHVARWYKNL